MPAYLYLKSKDKTLKSTAIFIAITDGRGIRYQFTTGISVAPKNWSDRDKKVKSSDVDAVAKNGYLKKFKDRAYNTYLDFKGKGITPTKEELREALKPKKRDEVTSKGFWGAYKSFLDSKSRLNSKSTIQKLERLKTLLEEYSKDNSYRWEYETATSYRLEDFQYWLIDTKNHQNSTAIKVLNNLKTFFLWCYRHNFTEERPFDRFVPLRLPESKKVTLSLDELKQIRSLEIPQEKSYLINARKLFILSCNVGLRNSDYSRISREHYKMYNGKPTLEIQQQKTGETVRIKLNAKANPIVKELIDEDSPLHSISSQKLNKYIKELCQLAGITEPVEVIEYRSNKKVSRVLPKYQLIGTHTGRRTFATNLILEGTPVSFAMRLTGHKSEKSFWQYVNVDKNQAEEQESEYLDRL